MANWTRDLKSSGKIRRQFPGGEPRLAGLRLLRVVLGPEYINIVLGFASIPHGATEKWRKAGYTAVDVVLRLESARDLILDTSEILKPHISVEVNIESNKVMLRADCGVLLQASYLDIGVEFVPDPDIQRYDQYRDEEGTDLEPY